MHWTAEASLWVPVILFDIKPNQPCVYKIEWLSGMHKVLGPIPALHKPGMMVHTCHLNPWQIEAGGAEVQGHPWPHSKSEAILSCMRSYLKRKKSTHQKRISIPRCLCPKPSFEMFSHSICLILLNQNTVVSYILDLFSWYWITNLSMYLSRLHPLVIHFILHLAFSLGFFERVSLCSPN